jgi:predicted permease
MLLNKLRILLHRNDFNRDLSDEIAFHREQKQQQFEAEGMSAEEARHAAARAFGNAPLIEEESREVAGFRMETVWQDLRFALRQLRRYPGFAVIGVAVLALGFSASIAMFMFVDAALLKPLPYRDPARLVAVYERANAFEHSNLSYPDYLDWKRQNTVFSDFAMWNDTGYLLGTSTGAQPIMAMRVSADFFRTLGVQPMLGRDFHDGEDQSSAPHTVVLSYAAWQKHFGGRTDVIGTAVDLSGESYTVIGVLPRTFQFAPRQAGEIWTAFQPREGSCDVRRSCHGLYGVARLKPGVALSAALAQLKGIASQLEQQYPDSNRGQSASVTTLNEAISGQVRPVLLMLFGGAALLLLIACINVFSLLLARAESRQREIAVRGALGASPQRLTRQFVTEAAVLVVLSLAIGIVAAIGATRLLLALIPATMQSTMPFLEALSLNARVLAFTLITGAIAIAIFSGAPLLRMHRRNLRSGLSEAGRGSVNVVWRRLGSNLVIAELAIAVVLLVTAGLLGKSLYRLLNVDLGFDADHLATFQLAAPDARYPKPEQQVALAQKIVDRLASVPGVTAVAHTSQLPIAGNGNTDWVRFADRPYSGEHNEVNERDVSSNYFYTVKAKLLRGRYFTEQDDANKPNVSLINQAFANKYFPGQDPVGKRYGDTQLTPKSMRTIIGVVSDVHDAALDDAVWPAEYLPFKQSPDTYLSFVIRTAPDESAMLPSLVAAARAADASIGVFQPMSMSEFINDSPAAYLRRSSARLVGSFAAVALLLGVVGLYGVIAYSVAQRTREIGVRMALGAQRGSVYRLVMQEAGALTFIGIGVGLVCAVVSATLLRTLLFSVKSWDVSTLSTVALMLAAAALIASFVPAHRAASVNPVDALRSE